VFRPEEEESLPQDPRFGRGVVELAQLLVATPVPSRAGLAAAPVPGRTLFPPLLRAVQPAPGACAASTAAAAVHRLTAGSAVNLHVAQTRLVKQLLAGGVDIAERDAEQVRAARRVCREAHLVCRL
jgi:hypothetical protein